MCCGGGFGQYPVSFWIAELRDEQWFALHAEKVYRQLRGIRGVREAHLEPSGGKVTLLCVPGWTDSSALRSSIAQLGYTVLR
ncbi:hypothetical protein SY88_14280 [Clostridiales bacterium PH28_bin88]|nr:hypothetical protein SY88_14280 [Clostridiales bacterium PH28_bin88]